MQKIAIHVQGREQKIEAFAVFPQGDSTLP
jgi:hypothetical protein